MPGTALRHAQRHKASPKSPPICCPLASQESKRQNRRRPLPLYPDCVRPISDPERKRTCSPLLQAQNRRIPPVRLCRFIISQILAGRQKEQQKEALRKEMAASRQALKDALQKADNDSAYQQALQDYRDADNDYNNNQLKKDLKQAIADLAAGKGSQAEVDKAQQAVDAALKDKTSDLYKLNETKEKAKETVEQNPLHKDLQTAKDTYNQTMQKGIDFVLGDPNNPDYARRLDRIKKISSRDLKDRTSVLTQRQGESAQAFADRKKAIKDGRWVDTLIRKPNESDADYQARQQALQTKWQQNGIDPDARVKDKEINQQRRLTQKAIQKAIQNAVRSR